MTYDYWVQGFYPRHPRGWRPAAAGAVLPAVDVSIHATLAGGDRMRNRVRCWMHSFYPRHPRGWRPGVCLPGLLVFKCFYPRHPRGWRQDIDTDMEDHIYDVSIHATLAGGDDIKFCCSCFDVSFYPRHPRGWRPSHGLKKRTRSMGCFYPRHPRGWRRPGTYRTGR